MTHNAFRSLSLPALLAAGLLSGCSNQPSCGNSHPYLANSERPPLAAPSGVSVPAPDQAYVIPGAQTAAGQAGSCMIRPPDVLGPQGAPGAASTHHHPPPPRQGDPGDPWETATGSREPGCTGGYPGGAGGCDPPAHGVTFRAFCAMPPLNSGADGAKL